MAIKKENKRMYITLTAEHLKKLGVICAQMGLSKTGVVQRMIENYSVVEAENRDPA